MEDFTIEVSPRNEIGSSANRRFRNQGLLPSVIYSHGEPSVATTMPMRDFLHRAENATFAQVFTLKSGDKRLDGRPAIVKEVQMDRLHGKVLHVDFQVLREDEEITVRVPMHFIGDAFGVKDQGGILSISAHNLSVSCLPRAIPKKIEVEVAALKIGDSIHASDLKLPENVKLAGNPGETIVSVVIVKQVVEETAAATTAEGAEGAVPAEGAEAGAEGAAPAEGKEAAAAGAEKGGEKGADKAAAGKGATGGKEKK